MHARGYGKSRRAPQLTSNGEHLSQSSFVVIMQLPHAHVGIGDNGAVPEVGLLYGQAQNFIEAAQVVTQGVFHAVPCRDVGRDGTKHMVAADQKMLLRLKKRHMPRRVPRYGNDRKFVVAAGDGLPIAHRGERQRLRRGVYLARMRTQQIVQRAIGKAVPAQPAHHGCPGVFVFNKSVDVVAVFFATINARIRSTQH